MAYTTIDDPSAHFQTKIYTGNGSSQSLTFDGNSDMQPDWLWTKSRGDNSDPIMRDSSRGIANRLLVHATDAEGGATGTTSFDSDGFSLDSTGTVNANTQTFVAWGWKGNGGTTSSDSNGDQTSTVQVNTTAGFSIATFAASSSAGQTVGHGLGAAPEFYIWKSRARDDNWYIYHKAAAKGGYLRLNTTDAHTSNTNLWSNTDPSSTVIYYGGNSLSTNNENHVLYSFTPIQGYSQFGTYEGNGSEQGPFVYLGFKPEWILFKNLGAAEEWVLQDTTRNPINPVTKNIRADSNIAEADASSLDIDFLSNGFKNRSDQAQLNSDGVNYAYIAFAEHPFVSSEGVPTTAR